MRFPGNRVGGPHRPRSNAFLFRLNVLQIKGRAKPVPDSNRIIAAFRPPTIPIGNNRLRSKLQRAGGRTSLHSSMLTHPSLWTPKFPQLTRQSLFYTLPCLASMSLCGITRPMPPLLFRYFPSDFRYNKALIKNIISKHL